MNRVGGRLRPQTAIVVGAGVVGVATAYALARRGLAVTLVDRAPEAGRGTSFANGAQLSYAYTDALASPALLTRLPALAIGADPAFRLRATLDPDFLGWGLRFLANCTDARFRANTLAGLRLGLESQAAMAALLVRHPLDFSHARTGKIHLYDNAEAFAAARAVMALKTAAGAVQHGLTPAEAIAIEPALSGRPGGFHAAIHSPQEEVGDPYRFCTAMAALLASDYGVTLRFGTAILRVATGPEPAVTTEPGERIAADRIVLCAGVTGARLLAGTGVQVSLWPMKGYSFTAPAGAAAPRVSITDVGRKLVFCMLEGRMRVAGLAELGDWRLEVVPRRLQTLVGAAQAALPEAADYGAAGAGWVGLRPMTPDSLPIVREAAPGLFLNLGHGTLGWTFAMGTAERVAELAITPAGVR